MNVLEQSLLGPLVDYLMVTSSNSQFHGGPRVLLITHEELESLFFRLEFVAFDYSVNHHERLEFFPWSHF